jgi:hypothetical protein
MRVGTTVLANVLQRCLKLGRTSEAVAQVVKLGIREILTVRAMALFCRVPDATRSWRPLKAPEAVMMRPRGRAGWTAIEGTS